MRSVDAPLSVGDVVVDRPASNEVLIDVAAVGLCHSDLKFIQGAFPVALPAILGHEASGVVAAVGSDISLIRPGERVLTSLTVHCGSCSYCSAGQSHLCSDKGATRRQPGENPRLSVDGEEVEQCFNLGAFAEQILVHESAVVVIEDDVPDDVAALLGCGVATGLGAVFNTAKVVAGESVAVIGCGGVGLSAIQAARIAGASPIIAIDRNPASLELARSVGATHTVETDAADPVAAVRQIADGEGVQHVIEAVGSVPTVQQAFAMARRGGTATVVGLIPAGVSIPISGDELFYERRLQGSLMGSNDFQRDIPRYLDLYREGSLRVDDMVRRHITLTQINKGFDAMRAGEPGRTVIRFG